MNSLPLLIASALVLMTSSVMADSPAAMKPAPAKTAKKAAISKMTCEEFLEYDDVSRPQIVYWSEGLNKKGRFDDEIIDFDMTDRLVPVLVEDCTKEPKATFWSKIKMEFKKVV